MAPSQAPFTMAIIGGGISGLCLALSLHARRIPIKIYEQAPKFAEIGAGLGFSPNAVRAMRLCDADLFAAFERVATGSASEDKRNLWFDWVDGWGRDDDRGPTGGDGVRRIGGERWLFDVEVDFGGRKGNAVHRAQFLEEVLKLMPEGSAVFNKHLDKIVEAENGRLVMHFADGSTDTADVVIGCDGIKSRVRQLVIGDQDPASFAEYTHKYAYRGLIPMDKAVDALGEEVASNRLMHVGPDGHVLTFPIAKGKMMNVVAFRQDDKDWPTGSMVVSSDKTNALRDYDGWHSNVTKIMELLLDNLDCWAIFDTGTHPLSTYSKGRVCVLGDAAHASSPHHGAGAGFCVEDSLVMAEILSAASSHVQQQSINGDSAHDTQHRSVSVHQTLKAAFDTFTAQRRQRTQWLVQSSRALGDLYDLRYAPTGRDAAKMKEEIESRARKIWDADVEEMVKSVIARLEGRCKIILSSCGLDAGREARADFERRIRID